MGKSYEQWYSDMAGSIEDESFIKKDKNGVVLPLPDPIKAFRKEAYAYALLKNGPPTRGYDVIVLLCDYRSYLIGVDMERKFYDSSEQDYLMGVYDEWVKSLE